MGDNMSQHARFGLSPNNTNFSLEQFPPDVVELFRRGGQRPVHAVIQRKFPMSSAKWRNAVVGWLVKNCSSTEPAYRPKSRDVVAFKVGMTARVSDSAGKVKPGSQVVKVVELLNDGGVVVVQDPAQPDRTYYTLPTYLVPIEPGK